MNDSHITGIWSCVTLVNGLFAVDWTSIRNQWGVFCFGGRGNFKDQVIIKQVTQSEMDRVNVIHTLKSP